MSNQLKVAMIETILSLRQRGWSQRRIARELGIDRQTVARYLQQQSGPAKPAIAPLGSIPFANPADQEPLTQTEQVSRAGQASDCLPWRAVILTKRESGLSAQRIYQDLLTEHGFTGSYYRVRRFVRHLDATQQLPFRRLECAPGEEARVDFGTGAPILLPDGKRRRTHVFRIVLSHSRKAYSEAVYRQSTDDFLRCLENAFGHFGGVPQRLIVDNLRAAVSKADWYDPDLNPKVRSFGQHYGVML
jgi:transposase